MNATHDAERRLFIKNCAAVSGGSLLASLLPAPGLFAAASPGVDHAFEARWYEKLPYKKVKCRLCPRECVVDDRERGYCGVRENWDGVYYSLVYSRPCTYHIDPIEKKPLFHFLPGAAAFSLATVGCNVDCKFCQNWQISQTRPEQVDNFDLSPKEIAEMAHADRIPVIACTYSEPVVFSEYMHDIAREGNDRDIRSVMISNGYIQEAPMRELAEVLTAVKIDLKAFTEKYYREIVAGELKPVLDTLVLLRKLGIWTEIVYLMVPTLNDSDQELKQLSAWVARNLGKDVPVHFTRFYPQYRMQNLPPTPLKTLERARDIALGEGLHYVYVGNVPGHAGENTYCPDCQKVLIRRKGFLIMENRLENGKCPDCGASIPGIWT